MKSNYLNFSFIVLTLLLAPSITQAQDADGDFVPDFIDFDDDNDGISDEQERELGPNLIENGGFDQGLGSAGWVESHFEGTASGPVIFGGVGNSPLTSPPSGPVNPQGVLLSFVDNDGNLNGVSPVQIANTSSLELVNGLDYSFAFDAVLLETGTNLGALITWVLIDPSTGGIVQTIPGSSVELDGIDRLGNVPVVTNQWQTFGSSFTATVPTGTYQLAMAFDVFNDPSPLILDFLIDRVFFAQASVDTDNDGLPDSRDLDSDNDGITDSEEAGSLPDADGNGIINNLTDLNGNGLADAFDPAIGGRLVIPIDSDRDGIADFRELDSDGDGIPDSVEAEVPEDTDGDGVVDSYEDLDGDGVPDSCDIDQVSGADSAPADGILDICQTGPDSDGDRLSDATDPDVNGDGFSDSSNPDNGAAQPTIPSSDSDGLEDYRDLDSDSDGLSDDQECNAFPCEDFDQNGLANFRSIDSDGDGIPDITEGSAGPDADANGLVDNPSDSDGDGLADVNDVDQGGQAALIPNTDRSEGPDYLDLDADNDRILDELEAGVAPARPVDTDREGIFDFRDLDSDNDGLPDTVEAGTPSANPVDPVDTNGDGIPDFQQLDSDGDGIVDATEADVAGDVDLNGIVDSVEDADFDQVPDICDPDFTAGLDVIGPDGILDRCQPGVPGTSGSDIDDDGIDDTFDPDANGDGFADERDPELTGVPLFIPDTDQDSFPDYQDLDSDNDGLPDSAECGSDVPCPDADGDGIVDHRELDSDNDGIFDVASSGGADRNGDGIVDCLTSFGPTGFCPEFDDPSRLRSPIFVKWNTFLSQLNFLEMAVQGEQPLDINYTVYNLFGETMTSSQVSVAGGDQQDLDLNTIVQGVCDAGETSCSNFIDIDGSGVIDSYGLVRLDFDDSDPDVRLVGRLSNYRPEGGLDSFSFAFAREFRNPNVGVSSASSNTFDLNASGFVVPNWTEVINLSDSEKDFTVNLYSVNGELVKSDSISLLPLEERDVSAGHEIRNVSGGVEQAVYLVEVIPADTEAEYLMSVARYSSNSLPGFDSASYNFAFAVEGRSGQETSLFGPITNENLSCGQIINWVEVINTSDQTESFTVTFRDSLGSVVGQTTDSYPAKSQINFNANSMLPAGELGSVQVQSSSPGAAIAQSLVYIMECDSSLVQTAYMIQLRAPGSENQVGSGNTFIQMENFLRLVSTNDASSLANFSITSFSGLTGENMVNLASGGTQEVQFSSNPAVGFGENQYGILEVATGSNFSIVGDVLRIREIIENGQVRYDFVMSSPLR